MCELGSRDGHQGWAKHPCEYKWHLNGTEIEQHINNVWNLDLAGIRKCESGKPTYDKNVEIEQCADIPEG